MTELDEILGTLVDNVDGTLYAAVGGMDGLLIEQAPRTGEDLSAATAEVTNVLTYTRSAFGTTLDGGDIKELIVTAEKMVAYTRMLDDELFCIVIMNPAGNIGKARLYSEQAARQILEVFA